MGKQHFRPLLVASCVALGASWLGYGTAGAQTSQVFVSSIASPGNADQSCTTAAYTSIQAAVEAAPNGGTVVVCPGSYAQSVTVDRHVNLQGKSGAIIDANGQPYGIGIAADYVTVSGFTVENANAPGAPDDGIITAGFVGNVPVTANHATITHNVLLNNYLNGIDLNTTSNSTASDNISEQNGVGINVTNDLGPSASHNVISGNVASNNPGGCGIVLADHSGSGVFANLVTNNVANNNGLGTSSAPNGSSGSGIIMAGGPGAGVYNNTVSSNTFNGNGHGGVVIHAHVPGGNYSGNIITSNSIGTNNLRQDESDPLTTGVYIGAASPLFVDIAHNQIHDDAYGIFAAGPVAIVGTNSNTFTRVGTDLVRYPTFS